MLLHPALHEAGLVIAIATALQESGLRNLDYGDRDSLGLLEQARRARRMEDRMEEDIHNILITVLGEVPS